MKYSVIIPVYNSEKTIKRCIESITSQARTDVEIIVINDGSTDMSESICNKMQSQYNNIVYIHKGNGGVSSARNLGLSVAKGKYVMFIDSDDYVADNTLKSLITIAEKDNSDIVFFDAVSFADTPDFTVKQNYIHKHKYKSDTGYNVFSAMTRNKEYHSAVPLQLFRKDLLTEGKIRFIPGILYEDMIFTYQALCFARVVSQCDKALYYRRYRKNSIMTSAKKEKNFALADAIRDELLEKGIVIKDFEER